MTSLSIVIQKSGLFSTIQDGGRIGWQHSGVPVSGPMDFLSYRLGNILVGNPMNTAAIEMIVSGATFEFRADAVIAITGANMQPTVENIELPMWRPIIIRAGVTIRFKTGLNGYCTYLAIHDGIQLKKVLGSYATSVNSGLSGYFGRKLQAGDVIPISQQVTTKFLNWQHGQAQFDGWIQFPTWSLSSSWYSHLFLKQEVYRIAIVKGYEWKMFEDVVRLQRMDEEFLFTLHPASNRMGYRLIGPQLHSNTKFEMSSSAVTMGTIQVPPDGNPIVLMADCQTTGGYARFGQIVKADLPKFAQLRPGARIRFYVLSIDEAVKKIIKIEREMEKLQSVVKSIVL